jgi:hypothetical protein
MNPELEKELETQISRVLQELPDLAAPRGLLARTMTALEEPAPWHARSWTRWPAPVRIAFLACGLAVAAAIILGWRAAEPDLLATASRHLAPVSGGLLCFWKALNALAGASVLAVEHLGKGFMLVWIMAAAAAWAVCAGLGTVLVRLTLSSPESSQL